MRRNQQGFTLIEITAVLVLMAIISAYVIGRSVTTEQVDLVGQTDRIRNQIRFAQTVAMKQSNRIWGIKLNTSTDQYWLFSLPIPVPANAEDLAENRRIFPGETNNIISFADLELDDITPSFTLFFDRIGRPFSAYINEGDPGNAPINNDLNIIVSAGGQTRTITVIPETGLVQ
jgi:prepilin-type N-terminal cleavage/methylation domain-containing protein